MDFGTDQSMGNGAGSMTIGKKTGFGASAMN
jgi:hypothetical protein